MNIHVKRIENKFEEIFQDYVDMSDVNREKDRGYNKKLNSRRLAAYAVMMKANISPELAAKAVTDGSRDCGIDAIFNDENSKELLLVQAKWSEEGTGTISQGDALKFAKGISKMINLDFKTANEKIQYKKSEIFKAISEIDYKIRAVIIYTSKQSLPAEAAEAIEDLKKCTNDDLSDFLCNETINIDDIYNELTNASGKKDICIDDVLLSNWGAICDSTGKQRGYYGMIDGGQIAEWWSKYDNMLLDKNIRNFKGDTDVNKGISNILLQEPENFIYYNNGIKIIAKKITRKIAHSTTNETGLFSIEGVSVVNGAQTTGTIGKTYIGNEEKVSQAKVMAQFISLEDFSEEFGANVTKLSNTQNRIENKDFVTMDPFQEKLRIELLMDGIDYTYKDGRMDYGSSKKCTIDDVAISIGCSLDDMGLIALIKGAYGGLFEDINKPPYKMIFNPEHSTYKIWNFVSVYRVFEKCNSECRKKMTGIHRLISIHANRYLLHLVLKSFMKRYGTYGNSYINIDEKVEKQINSWLEAYIENIVNVKNEKYPDAYPANIFKNANRCKVINGKINIL